MGSLVELITPYHTRTQRDYLARMVDDKVHCMEKAREYGKDYWDGDRRYGYGGYVYDGRWKALAEQLILHYNLGPRCRILDVGCGKAHLLHELKQIYPHSTVRGFDPSEYAISNAPEAIRPALSVGRAQDSSSYRSLDVDRYDLVLAMGSLHNLKSFERREAYRHISEAGRHKYLWVESYRNAQEQFNLQCWALTCWAFLSEEEWLDEFGEHYYTGDYEFVYFT